MLNIVIQHQDHRRAELYCSNTEVRSTDRSEQVVSAVQKNPDKCPEISGMSSFFEAFNEIKEI